MLVPLKRLFKMRVIVKEGLLKVLNRGQIKTLDVARGCIDRFEVVPVFDVMIDQPVVDCYRLIKQGRVTDVDKFPFPGAMKKLKRFFHIIRRFK